MVLPFCFKLNWKFCQKFSGRKALFCDSCGGLGSWHFLGLGSFRVGRGQHHGHIHLHGVSVGFVVLDSLFLRIPISRLLAGYIDDLSERGEQFDLGDVHVVLCFCNLGQIGSEKVAGRFVVALPENIGLMDRVQVELFIIGVGRRSADDAKNS